MRQPDPPPNSKMSVEPLAQGLRRHVDLLAGLIGPRHLGRPSSLQAAAAYIEQQFAAIGDRVKHESYEVGDETVVNLIIDRAGAAKTEQIVILGAHYDTVPETPGADDNASAVAVLIEAARLLAGRRTRRTIRFAAFTCEEPPHFYTDSMGSQIHARRCRQSHERIVGMLCLEMVGFFSTAPGCQRLPPGIPSLLRWAFPRRGDFLAAVGDLRSAGLCWRFRRGFKRATRLPLFSIVLPQFIREIRLSDNSSFWDQGYPALMITDTSFLRNPHYHQATDTPDTLDYARMGEVTRGVAEAVAHLALPDRRA